MRKEKVKFPMKWMFFAIAQFQIERISYFDSTIVTLKIPTVFDMIDTESYCDEDDDEDCGIPYAIKVIHVLKTEECSFQAAINKRRTYNFRICSY